MIKVIGHRGAAAAELENTFVSFKAALKEKVFMIETDVQVTKDNQFVIFHDRLLDRISDGKGYVSDFTMQELKRFTLKDGSKILELKELCTFIKDKPSQLFTEIKSEWAAEKLYRFMLQYLPASQFVIGSFLHNQVYELKQKYAKTQTCIIFESYPVGLKEYIHKINPDYVSVGFESVTDEMVEEIKSTEKKILFWTIDNTTDLAKAIHYNPFGIISNNPRLINVYLKEQHLIPAL